MLLVGQQVGFVACKNALTLSKGSTQGMLFNPDYAAALFNKLRISRKVLCLNNNKAELSQGWPRDAPYVYRHPENFWESLTMSTATFPEIFNGLLFRLSP